MTLRVDWPIAHLFFLPVDQARLAQDDLIFARIAKMIRRAIVWVGQKTGDVNRTFDGAVEFTQRGQRLCRRGQLTIVAAAATTTVCSTTHTAAHSVAIRRSLFDEQTRTVRVERPHAIALRLLPQQTALTREYFRLTLLTIDVLAAVFRMLHVAVVFGRAYRLLLHGRVLDCACRLPRPVLVSSSTATAACAVAVVVRRRRLIRRFVR